MMMIATTLQTWVGLTAIGAALVSMLSFPALRKPLVWAWRTNVSNPHGMRVAKRDEKSRQAIRGEVLDDVRGQLAAVIHTELKQRNGGSSITDLSDQVYGVSTQVGRVADQVHGLKAQLTAVETEQKVQGLQLQDMDAWQKTHSAQDSEHFANDLEALQVLRQRLEVITEQQDHARTRLHDVINAVTPSKGKTDLLWADYLKREAATTPEDP